MDERSRHRESISSGIRWSSIGQGVRAVFQVVVSIILARLLSPQDFGLVAMAGVITGFIVIFQFMGTSAPIIQRKDLSDKLVNSVFLLNVFIGIGLTAMVIATSPLLTEIYGSDKVTPILRVLGVNLLVISFGGVPGALLRRRMRFDVLAKISIFVGFSTGILEIILAYLGFGVWALVSGQLIASLIETSLMFISARYRPRWVFDWEEIKGIWSISANMTGTNVVNFLSQNADVLILGRWLGSSLLGYYTTAMRFSVNMLQYFAPVLGRVMFPAYSSMQDDHELFRMTVRRASGGITFFTFPMMAGIAAIAKPFVIGIIGEKWAMIIPMLPLLGIVGMLKSLIYPINSIFLARDRADILFKISVIYASVTIAAFLVGSQYDLMVVVYCMIAAQVLLTGMEIVVACRLIGLRVIDLLKSIVPNFIASVGMFAGVFLLSRFLMTLGMEDYLVVIIGIALGVVLYSAYALIYRPPALTDLYHVLPNPMKPFVSKLLRIQT